MASVIASSMAANNISPMASFKVVITGGSGCLGIAIVQCLQARLPHALVCVLDVSTPFVDGSGVSDVDYHQVDVCDATAISNIITQIQPRVVIHTAGLIPSAAKRLGVGDVRLRKVNVEGTQNVLNAARSAASVVAFVHTSSCDVIKDDSWRDLSNANESITPPQKFNDAYAETKVAPTSFSAKTFPTDPTRPLPST
jgi:sterol-4alpha-carboxylate 3-dehydrogenase (decarboxylating)